MTATLKKNVIRVNHRSGYCQSMKEQNIIPKGSGILTKHNSL